MFSEVTAVGFKLAAYSFENTKRRRFFMRMVSQFNKVECRTGMGTHLLSEVRAEPPAVVCVPRRLSASLPKGGEHTPITLTFHLFDD